MTKKKRCLANKIDVHLNCVIWYPPKRQKHSRVVVVFRFDQYKTFLDSLPQLSLLVILYPEYFQAKGSDVAMVRVPRANIPGGKDFSLDSF